MLGIYGLATFKKKKEKRKIDGTNLRKRGSETQARKGKQIPMTGIKKKQVSN